jgi:uncharacterized coiled-coil protein SlyX
MSDGAVSESISELEIKIAFQDKVIADLDTLVRKLGVRIDELSRELTALKAAVGSPELPMGGQNDKPPHY